MAIVRDSGSPVGCRAASLGGDGAWDDAGCKDGGGVAESLGKRCSRRPRCGWALRSRAQGPAAKGEQAPAPSKHPARAAETPYLSCPRPSLLPLSCPSCAAACTRPLARLPPFCPREAPTASAICRRVQAQYLLGVQSRPFVHSPVPLQLPRALKSLRPKVTRGKRALCAQPQATGSRPRDRPAPGFCIDSKRNLSQSRLICLSSASPNPTDHERDRSPAWRPTLRGSQPGKVGAAHA